MKSKVIKCQNVDSFIFKKKCTKPQSISISHQDSKVLQRGYSFWLSWANGGSGGEIQNLHTRFVIIKVRNPILCTVKNGLYSSWDELTLLKNLEGQWLCHFLTMDWKQKCVPSEIYPTLNLKSRKVNKYLMIILFDSHVSCKAQDNPYAS